MKWRPKQEGAVLPTVTHTGMPWLSNCLLWLLFFYLVVATFLHTVTVLLNRCCFLTVSGIPTLSSIKYHASPATTSDLKSSAAHSNFG